MSGKPRGGRRAGAGRRALLTYEDQVSIGAAIDEQIRAAAFEKFKASVMRQFADEDLELAWRQLNTIPVSRRRAHNERLAKSGLTVEEDDHPISQQLSDIRTAIGNKRFFTNPGYAPYGVRQLVFSKTAKERGISARMAERCLETYRAYRKRIASEEI